MDHRDNKLITLGIFLFLLGLIVGLIAPALANPRLAVSSHIEGVMNGMFLIILGLIWPRIKVSARLQKVNFLAAIYGTFVNWAGILIAAIFDGGQMLGIIAGGNESTALVEGIITFSLISLSVAMIAVCVITLIGLKKNLETSQA
jgi:hydroxylaminobenzene mutase